MYVVLLKKCMSTAVKYKRLALNLFWTILFIIVFFSVRLFTLPRPNVLSSLHCYQLKHFFVLLLNYLNNFVIDKQKINKCNH
jgi:hypothetical protein